MQQEYKISGVSVTFPCRPYPSQFSMMDKIIKGIDRRQNCLIESPTGSGKSLALLCSALAWLSAEKAKKELADAEETEKFQCTCGLGQRSTTSPNADTKTRLPADEQVNDSFKNSAEFDFSQDTDDFKTGKNFNLTSNLKSRKKHVSITYEDDREVTRTEGSLVDGESCCRENWDQDAPQLGVCACGVNQAERRQRTKIPKIFFGTRTHRQVAQIVRELRKTSYQNVKMTILGSREHTCIHGSVSHMSNKTEGCKELLKGPGCYLKDSTLRLTSHHVLKDMGLSTAWDLEELVTLCKKKRACPYFLSRGLKEEADLIICPYNYLVDPMVRDAMQIYLKGNIVILDEAHNIEDSAREAASQSLTQDSIVKAIKDIELLMEANVNLADHSKLRSMLKSLDTFIDTNKDKLEQKEFDRSYKIWSGFHIVAQLEAMGLGPKHVPEFKRALAAVKSEAEQQKEESRVSDLDKAVMEIKSSTQAVLEQMFQVLEYLYRSDLKYVDDYRASIVQSHGFVPSFRDGQWLSSTAVNGGRINMHVDVYTLNFWCMNPAVAFSDFSETRSIILTSGTLSPLTSFQSELGLEFKIQLEANHVIEDSQVWVGTLGQGPSGHSLQAVFRNLETFAFQDELGSLVLNVCQYLISKILAAAVGYLKDRLLESATQFVLIVPHGVLCFLPSYSVLDKLMSRWENTGLMRKLEQHKTVLREPKGNDKLDFEEQLRLFYETVGTKAGDAGSVDAGAVFFAVCRGKVSEGLDVADNFARAVITVGIPYPNFKDVQVELKRKYNDQFRHSRGLLTGSEWYEIQAFRALNQALGRCIRHRRDWGALIIVDDRFVKTADKYRKGLSKWVRNKVQTFQSFVGAMESLSTFTARQQALMSSSDSQSSPLLDGSSIRQSPLTSRPAAEESCSSSSIRNLQTMVTYTSPNPVKRHVQNFPIFNLTSPRRAASNSGAQASKGSACLDSRVANTEVKAGQFTNSPGAHQRGHPSVRMSLSDTSLPTTLSARAFREMDSPSVSFPEVIAARGCGSRAEGGGMSVTQAGAGDSNVMSAGTVSKPSISQAGAKASVRPPSLFEDIKSQFDDCLKSYESHITKGPCSKTSVATACRSPEAKIRTPYKSPVKMRTTYKSPVKMRTAYKSPVVKITACKSPVVETSTSPPTACKSPEFKITVCESPEIKMTAACKSPEVKMVTASESPEVKMTTTCESPEVKIKTSCKSPVVKVTACKNPVVEISTLPPTACEMFQVKLREVNDILQSFPDSTKLHSEQTGANCARLEATELGSFYADMSASETAACNINTTQPVNSVSESGKVGICQEDNHPTSSSATTAAALSISTHLHIEAADLASEPLSVSPKTRPATYVNPLPLPATCVNPPQLHSPEQSATPPFDKRRSNRKFLFKRVSLETGSLSEPVKVCQDSSRAIMIESKTPVAVAHVSPYMVSSITCSQDPPRPAAVPDDEEESSSQNEEKLQVRRKFRGKRKCLSGPSHVKRKKLEQGEGCEARGSEVVFTCSVCEHKLVENVQLSDFIEQRTVPSFLREAESKSQTGAIFFPAGSSLHDLDGRLTGLSSQFVEHEDICIQLLFCSQCLKNSDPSPSAAGAQVKLAAGPGARFSKGQVWLFSSSITQTQAL